MPQITWLLGRNPINRQIRAIYYYFISDTAFVLKNHFPFHSGALYPPSHGLQYQGQRSVLSLGYSIVFPIQALLLNGSLPEDEQESLFCLREDGACPEEQLVRPYLSLPV